MYSHLSITLTDPDLRGYPDLLPCNQGYPERCAAGEVAAVVHEPAELGVHELRQLPFRREVLHHGAFHEEFTPTYHLVLGRLDTQQDDRTSLALDPAYHRKQRRYLRRHGTPNRSFPLNQPRANKE